MIFVDYTNEWFNDCLTLFDKNCPLFFAENERNDYSKYLLNLTDDYKVALSDGKVIEAFGLSINKTTNKSRVTWIMVCPTEKGKGIGTKLMAYIKKYALDKNSGGIDIAASHLSAPFFAKFGAKATNFIEHGWGVDMHRVDMVINL